MVTMAGVAASHMLVSQIRPISAFSSAALAVEEAAAG